MKLVLSESFHTIFGVCNNLATVNIYPSHIDLQVIGMVQRLQHVAPVGTRCVDTNINISCKVSQPLRSCSTISIESYFLAHFLAV